jgi:hypothetical protein
MNLLTQVEKIKSFWIEDLRVVVFSLLYEQNALTNSCVSPIYQRMIQIDERLLVGEISSFIVLCIA